MGLLELLGLRAKHKAERPSLGINAARQRSPAGTLPHPVETNRPHANTRPISDGLDGARFGLSPDLDDNSSQLEAGLNAAAKAGKPLVLGPGKFVFTRQVIIPDRAQLCGAGVDRTRLEKNFVTTGSNAFLQPLDIGAGAVDVQIADLEIGASAHLIDGAKSNKLLWASGSGWHLENLRFKTWSGWACTVGGSDMSVTMVEFADPLLVSSGQAEGNGTDGLHIGFGTRIRVKGVRGQSADDLIAVATPLTGSVANRDIDDVLIEDVDGQSEAARLCVVGIWNAKLTASVRNVTLRNVRGRAGGNGGVILISSVSPTAVGCSDILLEDFDIDCGLCGDQSAGIRIRGGGPMRNVRLNGGRITNARGAVVSLHTIERFDSLDITGVKVDASQGDAAAFLITKPSGAKGLKTRDLVLICGTGDGLSVPGNASFVEQADVEVDIQDVGNGATGLLLAGMRHSRVNARAAPRHGANLATGMRGPSGSMEIDLSDSDFSAFGAGGSTQGRVGKGAQRGVGRRR